MRLVKRVLLTVLLAGGVIAPALATRPGGVAEASESKAQFSACPLPIPNCLPEYVFDFKQCRCVPRP